MDLSLPRGIRDIEPEEHELHQRIRRTFEDVAWAYNFKQMEPAPLETLAVLRAKSGSQVDEQIYYFRDKAEREIGLRFDLTVGMTRYVAGRKDLKPPVKLSAYGGVWRYDEPQHARYRWFYQWDVEVFGEGSVDSDAEVMDLCHSLFKRLGLRDVVLRVGDRRVVEEYVRDSLGVTSDERAVEMMRALDKVTKKSEEELVGEYETRGVSREDMKRLLEFGRTRGDPEKVLSQLGELGLESRAGLAELSDSLKVRGVRNVEYDLSIVRGIDYYTAIVFEVADGAHPELGSLCGGGRYDVLPRLFGRPELAATGAAGGVERIALSLGGGLKGSRPSVYVAYTEPSLMKDALGILSTLREGGVRGEIGVKGKRLSRQLEESASRGFSHTAIVGRKELEDGMLVLKDMRERREERIPLRDLVARLLSS